MLCRAMFSRNPPIIECFNIPDNWICNVRKVHSDGGRKVRDDSPDFQTETLQCKCLECLKSEIGENTYDIGIPVQVSLSYPAEVLLTDYVGIYLHQ